MAEFRIPKGNGLLIAGVVLVLLGIGSMIAPAFAGNAVVYLIGGLLLLTGLVQLIAGWQTESWREKMVSLIPGGIATAGGIAVMAHPFYGLAALSLVLALFFVAEGAWKIISSFSYRQVPGWIALLVSGMLDLILGVLIWRQWPVSGMWAVGILVGVNLLSTGTALISLAMTWKRTIETVQSKIEVAKVKIADKLAESNRP